jgi:DNA-binding IscR family transcriptional regulator
MILRQTEGSLSPVTYDDMDSREREAVISRIWTQLEEAIDGIVDNITLRDLVEWQTELISQYVI